MKVVNPGAFSDCQRLWNQGNCIAALKKRTSLVMESLSISVEGV